MNKLQNVFRTHKKGFLTTLVFLMLVLIVGVSCAFCIKGRESSPKGSEVVAETITPRNSGKWTDSGNYATSFAGGTGTEADPYLISNGAQLAKLASDVNTGTTYQGKYFKMTNDIDLLDFYWNPIGLVNIDAEVQFTFGGNIDGDNHVISGMVISSDGGMNMFGLLGYCMDNITIKNLGIEDSSIDIRNITGDLYVGTLAGYAGSSNITNCYSKANITVTNCNNYCSIGGLVGNAYGSKFNNCYNTGNISGFDVRSGIGGLTGASGSFTKCYNSGNIYIETTGSVEIGGISNEPEEISYCHNSGEINVASSTGYGIGGLGGYGAKTTNSYNSGNLIGNSSSTNHQDSIGGLFAYELGSVINKSFNTGNITFSSTSSNKVFGGLLGIDISSGSSKFTDCFNVGQATTADQDSIIYGLVGSMSKVSGITNCYSVSTANGFSSTAIGGSRTTTSDEKFGRIDDLATLMKVKTNFGTNSFGTYTTDDGTSGSAIWSSAWDFENIWEIDIHNSYNNQYPTFKSFLHDLYWIYNSSETFAGGTGTETDPYLISTPQQLAKISYDVSNQNSYNCKYFKLTNDIDLSGKLWTPIGNSNSKYFSGNIDGDSHVIRGMTIDGAYQYAGLVGYFRATDTSCTNIEIKNLGLVDGSVKVYYNISSSFSIYAAGLIGYVSISTNSTTNIINCYNTVNVCSLTTCSNSSSTTHNYIGGLIGSFSGGNGGKLKIVNSYNIGEISSNSTCAIEGNSASVYNYTGGLIAYLTGGNNISLTISKSHNNGMVYNTNSNYRYNSYSYAGGLIGKSQNNTEIQESYNMGVVCNTNPYRSYDGSYSGGLIGHGSGTINIGECYNTGEIIGDVDSSGGLIGCVTSTTNITRSYNIANFNGDGGLIGYVYCSSSSTISIIECYNTGNLGRFHTGGLIGYIRNTGSRQQTIEISKSFNTGNINSSNYNGGLIGRCYNESGTGTGISVKITESFNIGNIMGERTGGLIGVTNDSINLNNCFAECNLNANGYGGGLVGNAQNSKCKLTINSCYFRGEIESSSSFVGGLIGRLYCGSGSKINDCYAIATIKASNLSSLDYVKEFIGYNSKPDNITISNYYASADITYSGGQVTNKVYNGTFASDKWFYHENFRGGELTLKSIYLIGKGVDTTAEENLAKLTNKGFTKSAA